VIGEEGRKCTKQETRRRNYGMYSEPRLPSLSKKSIISSFLQIINQTRAKYSMMDENGKTSKENTGITSTPRGQSTITLHPTE
jgi:hypothetical protein